MTVERSVHYENEVVNQKKIDQTGILGCACSRHGHPLSSVDMYTPGKQLSFKATL